MANIMKEVASALGVRLGERFRIEGCGEGWYLDEEGLKWELGNEEYNTVFAQLLTGKVELVKRPWRPQKGELFYNWEGRSYDIEDWNVSVSTWHGHTIDLDAFAMGNCFRTEAEAMANKDKVLAAYRSILESLQDDE